MLAAALFVLLLGVMRMERASVGIAAVLRYRVVIVVTVAALTASCTTSGHNAPHAAVVASSTSSTTASSPSTTTTTIPLVMYRVRRGDTLGAIARHFHVSISTLMTTNQITNADHLSEGQTLHIPPAPPVKLTVDPVEGPAGQAFQLTLTGAVPTETITFHIASPAGIYTGGPHTAATDGRVTATYQTDPNAPPGTYTVTATGNLGTTARAGFIVTRP